MNKREVELDDKYEVPKCYAKFFRDQQSKPKPKPDQPKPSLQKITIKIAKRKNKDYTDAIFSDTIKLPSKQLKKFSDYLKKKYGAGASYKENPIIISLSGKRQEEVKEEILSFFKFDNEPDIVIEQESLKLHKEFKVLIMPLETGVEVSWKHQRSLHNLENDFEDTIQSDWKKDFENKSNRKQVIFIIYDVSPQIIEDYFMNKYSLTQKQIEIIPFKPNQEKRYRDEIMFDYRDPLKLLEKEFTNPKNRFFFEMSRTILDLRDLEKARYEKKKFNENLTFTRKGADRKGKIKWTTIINPTKVFSIDRIVNFHALNVKDSVIVTYRDRKKVFGHITEIDEDTGIVTALFLLNSDEKPPGYKQEGSHNNGTDQGYDYDDENEEDEEEEEGDDENDREKQEYEKFLSNIGTAAADDDDDDDDDEGIEIENTAFEEQRITKLMKDAEQELLREDAVDEDEEYEEYKNSLNNANDDSPYTIYFQKSEAFYEKCAIALLSLHQSKSEIRKAITSTDRFDDSKFNDKIKVSNASIDLTKSDFLTDSDKKDADFLKRLIIIPTPEQKLSLEMILNNNISIVHGGPGTGKTFSLSLFVYHLLKRTKEGEKQRILLCSKSTEDLKHIVKFVSPIVRAMGKKMVWVSYQNFENMKQLNEAKEEEKTLVHYQIMKRKTAEAESYQKLQEEKWDYDRKAKIAKRNNQEIPKFLSTKLKAMNEMRMLIESNLIQESDVVCCTISQSAKYTVLHKLFHTIFIDDAQQANEINSIIPLIHQPAKLILLGDSKQFKPYVNYTIKKKHPKATRSLYKKFMKRRFPNQRLNIQFRMNSKILEFPNHEFYSKQINTMNDVDKNTTIDLPFIKTPIIFVNVLDGKERTRKDGSIINNVECYVVQKIVSDLKICMIKGSEIGVMTPYYSQAKKLNRVLSSLKYKGLKVSTIENFQGEERDFIVLSLVRAKQSETEISLPPNKTELNVALTRARKGLIVVGKFSVFASESNKNDSLYNLCTHYQREHSIVEDSKIELLQHFIQKRVVAPLKITMNDKKNTGGDSSNNGDDDLYDSQNTVNQNNGEDMLDQFTDGNALYQFNNGGDDDDDFQQYEDYDDDDDDDIEYVDDEYDEI